ncbi:TOBE domain-containing protein [Sulfitobacter porphyrae]|uniref:TOBE domain-containing protein n=1 Tax=Sulfitobacter porphyrae TaxID=1246864 RepID=A0ABW2B9T3_9RHOB
MIRPEQVVVGATAEKAITLDGRIEALVFSGTDTHVSLRLQNGSTLSLRAPNTSHAATLLTEGQSVTVSLPIDALRVLPEETADAA